MFFDTHCHLDAPSLRERLGEVLDRAARAGVSRILVPGVDREGWDAVAGLSCFSGVLCAFGVHPMFAGSYGPETGAALRRRLPHACAVGEIGLDYTLRDVPRELQREAFREQLRAAAQSGLPVLIHCRKAFGDLRSLLGEVPGIRGVMHSFSGSPETAMEFVRLGLFISLSGTVTWGNAVRPLEVARQVPLENLLLETDAPDLSPEPYRGTANEPAYLVEIARRVAELKGISVDEVAGATTANAERLFSLRP